MEANPLNLNLLIADEESKPVTKPVTTTAIFVSSTKSFHPDGLFSNEIFGIQGTPERTTTYAHINLKAPIIHPRIYRGLVRAKRLYEAIMNGSEYAIWNNQEKDFERSTIDKGQTGYKFFISHINELKVKDSGSLTRDTLIKLLDKYPQRTVRYIPVMPAGLRDYVVDKEGTPSKDEVNDFYVRIIGITNVLSEDPGVEYDAARFNLQTNVGNLTKYLLDDTLYGFINKRWVNRRIFGGTKNVMTAYIQPAVDLDDPSRSNLNHTLIGLYQAAKASPEHVVYRIQNGFMRDIIVEDMAINVIDKKTLRHKELPFDQDFFDLIYSTDGINRLMSSLKYAKARSRPLEYNDNWLGIIYENYDDKEFMLLNDIGDLPSDRDKKYVRPITLGDMFYLSCHDVLHGRSHTSTRHPVMDNGGIYVGLTYLKTTNKITHMDVIDSAGNKTGETYVNYPIYSSGWYMSSSPNFSRLGPLKGDFDGDTKGTNTLNTEDADKEVKNKLGEARQWISANGSLHYSLGGGVLPVVLATITG